MPLTSFESYVSTSEEYITHWDQVNTALGSPMTLPGGYTRANLISDRAAIDTAITTCAASSNAKQISAGSKVTAKTQMTAHMKDFRQSVRALVPNQGYVNALPVVPKFTVNKGAFLSAFRDMKTLWTKINADTIPGFTPPLVLVGGFTLANFNTAFTALEATFATDDDNDELARTDRKLRDVLLKPMRTHLEQYRIAVPAALGLNHALTLSLPALYPPPGSTPDPVVLSGSWDSVGNQASLSCTAPTGPYLAHLTLKYSPAPYRESTATVVDNFLITQLTFLTTFGLIHAGAVADFKIYVVTTTGNQKGSNTVRITRPV